MNDKSAWFEELLTMEPNSKLFFPLAQTYAQNNRPQDAARVLGQGLSFYPEHLEARLLLIRCLNRLNQDKAAQEQTQYLTKTLSGYPEFWNFWAERSKETANQDVALMLRLLVKHLQGEAVHWGEILEQGIKAVIMADGSKHSASSRDAGARETVGAPGASATPELGVAGHSRAQSGVAGHSRAQPSVPPDQNAAAQLSAAEQPLATVFSAAPAAHPSPEAVRQLSETERNYYETRTYADLLAEQGEDEEALELYNKLLRLSQDDRQREELGERIATLKAKSLRPQLDADSRHAIPVQNTDQPQVKQVSPKAEPQKAARPPALVTTLFRLAERLEARSQA